MTLYVKNRNNEHQCSRTVTVDAAPPSTACSDMIDNDGDGLVDMNDTGCRSRGDDDESNGYARVITACSDGIDNDNDGFTDLKDIGCQNAYDNSEKNPEDVILTGGEIAQQICLTESKKKVSFIDIEDSFAKDVVLDLAGSYYSGTAGGFKGDTVIEGYRTNQGAEFRGDQPIRRDEAIKILTLASCLVEYDENGIDDTQKFNYKDPEFQREDYWAKKFAYRAANRGLINKVSRMHPESNVTRGEFAKMLVLLDQKLRGTKIENCERGEELSADMDFKHWSCRYFKTLDKLEIAGGITDRNGNYRLYPNGILDRANAAVWLNNYVSVINK